MKTAPHIRSVTLKEIPVKNAEGENLVEARIVVHLDAEALKGLRLGAKSAGVSPEEHLAKRIWAGG